MAMRRCATRAGRHRLPNRGQSHPCNICKDAAMFHCMFCEDLDVCNRCHGSIGNELKIRRLGLELYDDSARDEIQHITHGWRRNVLIQRCIESLEHVCQCRDDNCRLSGCEKMKRLVSHAVTCGQRGKGCTVCENVTALFCHHGTNCYKTICPVPFCSDVRFKLRQQKRVRIRMQRHYFGMPQTRDSQTQTTPSSSNSTYQQPWTTTPFALRHVSQPGIDINSSANPVVDALQTVEQQLGNLNLNNMFTNSVSSHPNIQLQDLSNQELG